MWVRFLRSAASFLATRCLEGSYTLVASCSGSVEGGAHYALGAACLTGVQTPVSLFRNVFSTTKE